jgi:hypothetical protein
MRHSQQIAVSTLPSRHGLLLNEAAPNAQIQSKYLFRIHDWLKHPLSIPSALTAILAVLSFVPRVQVNERLSLSLWGAASTLAIFVIILQPVISRRKRAITYEWHAIRAHYVQLAMHSSIYAYWGWYWPHVYHYLPLLIAQLIFGYALDMLVCWSRRDKYVFGFAIFPIVLSTNLFLWFKDDWFFLQFLMLAAAILCKEFVRWSRDGRQTHIFNPSGIALFLVSLALIATKSSYMTWGDVIANTLRRPPYIYLELFFLGLVVQALFSVTAVTLSAAAVLYMLNRVFTEVTGVYYFFDSGISVSLFLGLHFLITDPASSPRTATGKILFGGLYGAGAFATYGLLGWLGAPQFYDKLLCVPLLNLSVRGLDRISNRVFESVYGRPWLPRWTAYQFNLVHIGLWSVLFAVMMSTGFLALPHRGENPEFWRLPCQNGSGRACTVRRYLLRLNCERGGAESCVALADAASAERGPTSDIIAAEALTRGCNLGSRLSCTRLGNFVKAGGDDKLLRSCDGAKSGMGCLTLAFMYDTGTGLVQNQGHALELFDRTCGMGIAPACNRMAEAYLHGERPPVNYSKAARYFEDACKGDYALGCTNLAQLYLNGVGVPADAAIVRRSLRRGCSLGVRSACQPGEDPN